jgi:hypothetical protein
MAEPRTTRLVDTALRCYPARWRQRHGAEAAELAALLMKDGTPAGSIALSYLTGAARERLTPRRGARVTAVACAVLVAACSLGASAGLLASAAPARAASTGQPSAHPRCRLSSPEPLPALTQAMNRSQVISWEAGHDRSC